MTGSFKLPLAAVGMLLCTAAAAAEVAGRVGPVSLSLSKKPRSAARREPPRPSATQHSLAESTGAGAKGQLQGAIWADYAVEVTIGSQAFQVLVDTGSSNFAVAASDSAGCQLHYEGQCQGGPVEVTYGSGKWNGVACQGPEVTLAGLSAGTPIFDGILEQEDFLTACSEDMSWIPSQGILGLAYLNLMNGPGEPLFDSVVAQSNVSNIFAMQCCGWQIGHQAATGTLTLGGVNSAQYTGELMWTPVTLELYYCVAMTGVWTSAASLNGSSPATTFPVVTTSTASTVSTESTASTASTVFTASTTWHGLRPTAPPSEEPKCERFTGSTCFFSDCDQDSLGPSMCSWGFCVCKPGHCLVGGICVSEASLVREVANLTLSSNLPLPADVASTPLGAAFAAAAAHKDKNLAAAGASGRCNSIIDSGTSSIILTPDLYEPFMDTLNECTNNVMNADCVTKDDLHVFPNLFLSFAGGVVLEVPPNRYWQPVPDTDCLQLFIDVTSDAPSIIGQAMMEEYYTVFDRTNQRVGFAPLAGC